MGSPAGFSAQLDLDELQNVVDNGSGARSVATRQANALYNLGLNGTTAAMTAGTVKASSVVIVDANKDISAFRNMGLAGTLTFSGATTANIIAMPDNLADALNFKEATNSYLKFITTNGSEAVVFGKGVTLSDVDVALGTTTGTKIGTATAQKLGFWNATPVIQQAAAAQAAVTPSTDYSGADTVDKATVLAAVQAVETLVNRLRLDLVTVGIIKGAA